MRITRVRHVAPLLRDAGSVANQPLCEAGLLRLPEFEGNGLEGAGLLLCAGDFEPRVIPTGWVKGS
jgi:hypothetical protein